MVKVILGVCFSLIGIFIFTFTIYKTQQNVIEVTIYFKEYPSGEIQKKLNQTFEKYEVDQISWNNTQPNHIDKYPTIIITMNHKTYNLYDYNSVNSFFSNELYGK
jgi:hypothetical protein